MELLKRLALTNSPSGNEKAVRDIIIEEVKQYADEINVDTLGNLIVRKKGKGKKLMLSAHMDEIGIIATVIDKDNFVHFSSIGGVKVNALQNTKVEFLDGAIGIVAEKKEKSKEISDLFINILGNCKGNSLNNVTIGDVAVMTSTFDVSGDFVSSKALDNRSGCYILIQTLKSLSKTDNDLYFVFTVQEELGLRGAKTSAFAINPDFAIAVDTTPCDDIPGGGKYPLILGGGPAIKIKDTSILCHPIVKNLLYDSAKIENINVQYEVLDKGGTDAGAIQSVGAGVITGALSIPIRYSHTACETACISDIKNAVIILKRVCTEAL